VVAADRAWEYAQAKIVSGQYGMIILDEMNNAVDYELLPVEKIFNMLKKKPDGTTVVRTGRKAHDSIVKVADLVAEMREIKHPYRKGKKARKGIEF
jgi:cob(I)alamin adenosyltransferase